jgi:hypothetical protein
MARSAGQTHKNVSDEAPWWWRLVRPGFFPSVLGFLGIQLWTMNGTLHAVDTKVANVDQRVDRIAQALPDLRVRVAKEELGRLISSALIATRPYKSAQGGWLRLVHLIDPETSQATTYEVRLADDLDRKPIHTLQGIAEDAEQHRTSLYDLTAWSAEFTDDATVPAFVDLKGSLVFHDTSAHVLRERIDWIGPMVKTTSLPKPIKDWKDLSELLQVQQREFRPGG